MGTINNILPFGSVNSWVDLKIEKRTHADNPDEIKGRCTKPIRRGLIWLANGTPRPEVDSVLQKEDDKIFVTMIDGSIYSQKIEKQK